MHLKIGAAHLFAEMYLEAILVNQLPVCALDQEMTDLRPLPRALSTLLQTACCCVQVVERTHRTYVPCCDLFLTLT